MKKPHTILIVDDSDEIVMILKEEIEIQLPGLFQVLSCGKVSEANMKLANQKFDVVILDLHLKQGDGELILAQIKRTKSNPNYSTPFIVITGASDRVEDFTIQSLAEAVFAKPFDPKVLTDKIAEMVQDPVDKNK